MTKKEIEKEKSFEKMVENEERQRQKKERDEDGRGNRLKEETKETFRN